MITFKTILQEFKDTSDTREGLQHIIDSPFNIKNFENPSESMCEMAVELNPESIQFIKNPSENVMKKALNSNPYTIQYFIDKASPEIRKLALEIEPMVIKYFPSSTEEEQFLAINSNPDSMEFIKNPTEKVSNMYLLRNYKVGFLPF